MTLRKCLIANRGEVAARVIHACHELGIQTVAVYSDVDKDARHVRLADEAHPIGGAAASASYLNGGKLIEVASAAGCDCLHPGYGFLSEAPDFAQAVIDAGLVWVGPLPETIRKMGVKTEARALMLRAGVPLVPGFQSDTADHTAFRSAAERIGYPVMVKAAGGGGGKGIRVAYASDELPNALESAQREAQHAFGDPRVFLEKFIESGRHIEVQIIADAHGNVLHLYERECSTQRRHQKIIEETPSTLLTPDMRQTICSAAVDAAKAVNYISAGTVEFIATPDAFYFLEMNTRLQVEHPITELVTGVDVVKLQFRVAAGEPLPFTQGDIRQTGHAIECRVYAEDPHNHFLPATGTVLKFVPPGGPGVRVDAGVQSGDAITIHYDPMIAKIIVHDRTRQDAIHRMIRALRDTVILGTTTNIDFLLALLHDPAFAAGQVDTNYVDMHLDALMGNAVGARRAVRDNTLHMALIALALSEGQQNIPPQAAESDADRFSPWARADGFRMGR